ncbi:hypothetical protein MBLNU457_5657t1 [Dothideomycetes sp. NU457]
MADHKSYSLDPSLFNTAFYSNLLHLWLRTYPTPVSAPSDSDTAKWFGLGATDSEKKAFDSKVVSLCAPVLESIGPSHWTLPAFQSIDSDREAYYSSFAAPFVAEFTTQRPDSSIPNEDIALALIILLDQTTRNCFRRDEQRIVYEHYDRLARAVTGAIHDMDIDKCDRFREVAAWRVWFNMPLEHSESVRDHEYLETVLREMMGYARRNGDEGAVEFLGTMIEYEGYHFEPLRRFGRYPWRNRWMRLENTREEEKYFREGGRTFGTDG